MALIVSVVGTVNGLKERETLDDGKRGLQDASQQGKIWGRSRRLKKDKEKKERFLSVSEKELKKPERSGSFELRIRSKKERN